MSSDSSSVRTVEQATEILELTGAERAERDLTADDVAEALQTVISEGDQTDKQLTGVELPALSFEYQTLDGVNNHPIDLTGATIESLDLSRASVRVPVILDEVTLGELNVDYARFERDVSGRDATIGSLSAYETVFDGNAEFDRTVFEGPFAAREAYFHDDVSFDSVTFDGQVVFDAAELYGDSNRLDDNTSFEGAQFTEGASFYQTSGGYTSFDGATFEDDAVFTEASFDGDVDLSETTFRTAATFDETRFGQDTSFENVSFEAEVSFRGVEFRGGARTVTDDATFENATFAEGADFFQGVFRYVNFENATFGGDAIFELTTYRGDADFLDVRFDGLADFDETRFQADANFTSAEFHGKADFRGAEFHGGDNHLDKAVTFENVEFDGVTDFSNAVFTTALFREVIFADVANFRGAVFESEFVIEASQRTNEVYVDCTEATLKQGRIRQPDTGWVRYDFTRASLGDVQLESSSEGGDKELLDYFRFCETVFNEFDSHDFDFSRHTVYLDRNDWVLHDFNASAGYDPEVPLTPETIERTYLNAKIAASGVGNQQAAGEFRVKRQEFARSKYWSIVRDGTEDLRTRVQNAARALENRFLGITCGHGLRLSRIAVVFVLFPLIPTLLYTYGGLIPGFTPEFFATTGVIEERTVAAAGEILSTEGIRALYSNLSFAYITFLTIGYGNAAPQGGGANVVAAGSVYINVILGGLVLYALIKRSEV